MRAQDQLTQLNADVERLSKEASALHVETSAVARAVDAARSAARRAQLDEAISPSPEAKQTTAARVAALETILEKESATIERSRILAEALVELRAQRAPLLVQTDAARLDAARAALRTRIAKRASEFSAFVADVIALDKLESRLPHGFSDDKVLDFAAKQAGTSAGALNDAGRALGAAIASGRTEV